MKEKEIKGRTEMKDRNVRMKKKKRQRKKKR